MVLESTLARWKAVPAALCFTSRYTAALGTLSALASKQDVIILDKLCHPALVDGARLSGAVLRASAHNHLGKLESHLEWAAREHPQARRLIVTESIFGSEGDRAPLSELVELKKRFDALLVLDEAHAIGVLGPQGRGLAAELGLEGKIDALIGSLSNSLGVSGGYVCGSRGLIDWLINRARSFVFSVAPPPAIASAAAVALQFLSTPEGEERRRTLWKRIVAMRKELPQSRSDQPKVAGAIIPWIIGEEQRAEDLSHALQAEGFLVPAIRYPAVAKGAARLRITISAAHTEDQITSLGDAIRRLAAN